MNKCNVLNELTDSVRLVTEATSDDIANAIVSTPLFENLDWKEISILSRHFKLYTVKSGAVLFNEGDAGDFMAIVLDGTAEVTKENDNGTSRTRVAMAGTGKLIGEMALVDGEPRSARATFPQPAKILVLTRASFESIVSDYEKTGVALLWRFCRILSNRLRQTTGALLTYSRT